jgi:chaperone modulatory protein CbpM
MKVTTLHGDILEALSLQDLCRFCQAEETWALNW